MNIFTGIMLELVDSNDIKGFPVILPKRLNSKNCANPSYRSHIAKMAATEGNLNMLKRLEKHKHKHSLSECFVAIKAGHLNCVDYLLKKIDKCYYEDILEKILTGNRVKMLECYCNVANCSSEMVNLAAAYDSLDCLKYLHKNAVPLGKDVSYHAAYNNNLAMISYLREIGAISNKQIMCGAAAGGNLDLLVTSLKNCPWNKKAFRYAIKEGQLEIVRYLVFHGYSYRSAVKTAIDANQPEILKYLAGVGYVCDG